jgi:hypothetical protein
LPHNTANLDHGFAKICLGMASHAPAARTSPGCALPLPDVILDDRVATGETVLFAKTVKYPLRRMTLLARNRSVTIQPCIDDRNERFQLGPPNRRRPTLAGRLRIRQHLADRVARNVEMLSRLTLAHATRASKAHLQVKIQGINLQALPARAKKAKWTTFTPLAAALRRRYRGLILHRRSHDTSKNPVFLV